MACLTYLPSGVVYGDVKTDLGAGVGVVGDGGVNFYDCVRAGRCGRGDEGAPGHDVDGVGGDEADLTVDAGAGVPAGGGLLGVVDPDGDDVFSGVEVRREVVVEADVAVGSMAEEFAVAVDVGVGHDAVEGDVGAFGGVDLCNGEVMAIPADAGREETSGGAAGGVFFDGAGDAPVVGEVDGLPCGVVVVWGLGVGCVALQEAPARGELLDLAQVWLCGGDYRREKEK